ncbi:bcl2-associated agonist of cell death isoform X2 [Hoplias malabaricus]|uniref:bcl2-associated agonist of cell death isoform X2 n=1 Tax=Hoplias malabaricus TaxID=27720 RepID=UPI0034617F50
MSNQYLLKLRRARFNCEGEGFRKVFNTKTLTEEKPTLLNPLWWNPSPNTDEFRGSEAERNVDSSKMDSGHIPSADELSEVGARVRLYSESQVYTVSRWEDEDGAEDGDGAPFRGRSQSAPAALWKAKKYGRQLRRMSDEFDTWLDKGEMRKASSPGKQSNRGWFSFLWGPTKEEGRE